MLFLSMDNATDTHFKTINFGVMHISQIGIEYQLFNPIIKPSKSPSDNLPLSNVFHCIFFPCEDVNICWANNLNKIWMHADMILISNIFKCSCLEHCSTLVVFSEGLWNLQVFEITRKKEVTKSSSLWKVESLALGSSLNILP